jgi:hypothetical protein
MLWFKECAKRKYVRWGTCADVWPDFVFLAECERLVNSYVNKIGRVLSRNAGLMGCRDASGAQTLIILLTTCLSRISKR